MLLWAGAQKPITMSPPALARDWGRVILDTINWHQLMKVPCTVAECPFAVQLTSLATGLSLRPREPPCSHYKETRKCAYGPACKFHHPERSPPRASVRTSQIKSAVAPAGIRISLCI